ncbi:MAG: tetratricopeptide repeat protein [Candidatus Krumholzibacteriota bacterium]
MNFRIRTSVFMVILGCLCTGMILSADGAGAADRKAVVQRSRALLAEAREAFAAGQSDTALARLESVLVEDPANPDAFYFIGLIKLSHADTSGAEAALAEGVRLAPLSRRLKLLLARVWVESGKTVEADKLVSEVMVLRPLDVDALYIKGLIALAENDSTAAVEFWDTALTEELGGGDL